MVYSNLKSRTYAKQNNRSQSNVQYKNWTICYTIWTRIGTVLNFLLAQIGLNPIMPFSFKLTFDLGPMVYQQTDRFLIQLNFFDLPKWLPFTNHFRNATVSGMNLTASLFWNLTTIIDVNEPKFLKF